MTQALNKMPIHFDGNKTPLQTGLNLIEASAGTGKTFAIAMLVLRFVVEKGIKIESILVVTFTKAATEELKGRIRHRLTQAKRVLEGADAEDLADWLATLSDTQKQLGIERLAEALLSIDLAGIFTIHGFCAGTLNAFALESGQTFDAELVHSIKTLKQAIVEDFWRTFIYPLPSDQAALILQTYSTPSALLNKVDHLDLNLPSLPETPEPQQTLKRQLQRMSLLKAHALAAWPTYRDTLLENLAGFKADVTRDFAIESEKIDLWLQGNSLVLPKFDLLSEAFLQSHLKTAKKYVSLMEDMALNFAPFKVLLEAITQIPILVKQAVIETLKTQIYQRSLANNQRSFNDLIHHLSQALQAEHSQSLIEVLQAQYRVALIDEFQDTDTEQWFIFSTLFAQKSVASTHYCFLIGDPKQAIYKFRGADIYAYFSAQQQAQYHYTLSKNWRSHPAVVQGVNALFLGKHADYSNANELFNSFEPAEPFGLPELKFYPVEAAKTHEEGYLCLNDQTLAGLKVLEFELPEQKDFWGKGAVRERIRDEIIARVLDLIEGHAQIKTQADCRPLKLEDIAILVSSKAQAQAYQKAFKEAGLAAISSSGASVLNSAMAKGLQTLLSAIAYPTDLMKAKKALTLSWFQIDGQAYLKLLADSQAFDQWMLQLQTWHHTWQTQGVLVMLDEVLASSLPGGSKTLSVQASLIEQPNAERQLTDYWHLGELIQTQANENQLGLLKTLDWFQQALKDATHAGVSGEDAQIRLETDDNAIQIMTMHVSKGLEFPVVFCPDLALPSEQLQKEKNAVVFYNAQQKQRWIDLGSHQFKQHKQQALKEEASEQTRLLYVAVTRAKYVCYLPWTDIRSGKNNPNQSSITLLLEQLPDEAKNTLIAFETLPAISPEFGVYQKPIEQKKLILPKQPQVSAKYWRLSSYSGLVQSGHLPIQMQVSEQHDDIAHTKKELDAEDVVEAGIKTAEIIDTRFNQLPKGAHFGSCVHDCLEHLTFQSIDCLDSTYQTLKQQKADFYGVNCSNNQHLQFDEMMQQVVRGDLSMGQNSVFCLADLSPTKCLKEMPFYLAVSGLKVEQLNKLLQNSPICSPIGAYDMQGYLTGFVDLICEFEGQYYVMDYKTNWLENYGEQALMEAMKHHNYGLQLWIYSLVLHQYCQQRVPDYDYETHFGGVRYLFTRGMQSGESNGIYATKLPLKEIEKLDKVLKETL